MEVQKASKIYEWLKKNSKLKPHPHIAKIANFSSCWFVILFAGSLQSNGTGNVDELDLPKYLDKGDKMAFKHFSQMPYS